MKATQEMYVQSRQMPEGDVPRDLGLECTTLANSLFPGIIAYPSGDENHAGLNLE